MSRLTVNAIQLNVEVNGQGPCLLLLHGFTGSAATWTPFADACPGFTTVAVDLPGHGASYSPDQPDRYRMEHCLEDLIALLDRLGIGQAAVLGYSMGGRVALRLALNAPDRLWALVLESSSPGIPDAAERSDRVNSDAALAEAIERDGIEAFVDRWQALPLFASQARLSTPLREELRRQRLTNSPQGLANSLRGLGTGRQESVLNQLDRLRMPTLLLAGALDERYCTLARDMTAALPHARLEIVAQAGHAIHLEQRQRFSELVKQFLDEHRQQSAERRMTNAASLATDQEL